MTSIEINVETGQRTVELPRKEMRRRRRKNIHIEGLKRVRGTIGND